MAKASPLLLPPLLVLLAWPVARGGLLLIGEEANTPSAEPVKQASKMRPVEVAKLPKPTSPYSAYSGQAFRPWRRNSPIIRYPVAAVLISSPRSTPKQPSSPRAVEIAATPLALRPETAPSGKGSYLPSLPSATFPPAGMQNFNADDAKILSNTTASQPVGKTRRWSSYGYVFWRSGAPASLAPSGQYGGSQAAIQLRRALGNGKTDPAFDLRLASGFSNQESREIAPGISWQPTAAIPLRLHAERRIRPSGADSSALYLSGGFDGKRLPADLRLSGYGQLGVDYTHARAKPAIGFHDASLRIDSDLLTSNRLNISVGGLIRSGGQSGIYRLDTGPTAALSAKVAEARIELRADYRFRIAGSAEPASGPALTLSASY